MEEKPLKNKRISALKAIRAKCLDCSAGSYKEIRLCPVEDCPLWKFRSGHKPKLKEE